MTLTLEVKQRGSEPTDTLRKGGFIPAVFYGPKESATPIAIDARAFDRVFREAGETTIVTLAGVGDAKETLVRDVQFDALTGRPIHADFYVLEKGKKIEISVPLRFEGSSPAEKAGGVLVKAMHEIEIEVVPAELPHSLTVDLSVLANIDDRILAKDIVLPKSAELITEADEIIALIAEPEQEEAPNVAPAAEAATPAPEAAAQ